jgi:hypothetical protein
MAVGVTGEVGHDMADSPSWQTARQDHLLIADRCDRREQAFVGRLAELDRS